MLVHSERIYLYRAGGLLGLLLAWHLVATVWLTVFPTVTDTIQEVIPLLASSLFYEELGRTIVRVAGGFAIAFTVGLAVGTAMGLSRRVEATFELAVLTGVAAPGLFIAMIVLVALGINNTAAMIGIAVISMPTIIVTFWQATRALDRDLNEMARAFFLSRQERIRHIILPQLLPPSLAATRYGLGLAWKLAVLVELLGLSSGVGYQVSFHYQLFNLTMVLAWVIGFLSFVLLLEYALIRPIEKRVTHWRTHATSSGGRSRADGPTEAVATVAGA